MRVSADGRVHVRTLFGTGNWFSQALTVTMAMTMTRRTPGQVQVLARLAGDACAADLAQGVAADGRPGDAEHAVHDAHAEAAW